MNYEQEAIKQAIQVLSNISKAYRNFTKEEIIALEMAIQALKSVAKEDT